MRLIDAELGTCETFRLGDRASVLRPTALAMAVELTGSTIGDPGLGASVPTPPTAILIAGWVVGVIALAVLWAVSRR